MTTLGSMADLIEHEGPEGGYNTPIKCKYCGKKFSSDRALNVHIREEHKGPTSHQGRAMSSWKKRTGGSVEHDEDDKEIIDSIKKVVKNNPGISLEEISEKIDLDKEITLNYINEIPPNVLMEVEGNSFRLNQKLDEVA